MTVDLLVDDFEGLRRTLGIDSWCVLGHSAGGGYALEYAAHHPESVAAVVFDCPCWDCDLTDRYRLPIAARRLEALGKTEAARDCLRIAGKTERITVEDESALAMQALDAQYLDLFFRDPRSARAYEDLVSSAGFSDKLWARGQSHAPLLAAMYEPRLHLLDRITMPSLLIHGRADVVVTPEVVERYRWQVPSGQVHTFSDSGHFSYHEEPDAYADTVRKFVATAR